MKPELNKAYWQSDEEHQKENERIAKIMEQDDALIAELERRIA